MKTRTLVIGALLALLVGVVGVVLWLRMNPFRGPGFAFYEGNNGTQDQLCGVPPSPGLSVWTGNDCPNDEARSVVLLDVPTGVVLKVFDSPEGKREDDWTEIVTRREVKRLVIPSFENSYQDDDVSVSAHRNDGLDGKVSRVEVGNTPSGASLVFYEGNGASQNKVCEVPAVPETRVKFSGECDNDEARSVELISVPANTRIAVFDDPDGKTQDDWAELRTKRDISRLVIASFEADVSNDDVTVTYHRNDGLDGKVSRVEVTGAVASSSRLALYEGNKASQNLVCELVDRSEGAETFPRGDCDNDEARSIALYEIPAGRVIRVLDSADGKRDDDWSEIEVRQLVPRLVIDSFEQDLDTPQVRVTFHRNNGLDGKVSRVEFASAPTGPMVDFYEGNNATQNLVCSRSIVTAGSSQMTEECDNDEARSLVLRSAPVGTVFRVYDDPAGSRSDDWTEIVVKQESPRLVVGSFQASFEDERVRVTSHPQDGLDGKVSRYEIATQASGSSVAFFEGNGGRQNRVCEVQYADNRTLKLATEGCANDEARSLVIYNAAVGQVIRVFDDPNGRREDDWAQVEVLQAAPQITVDSFQRSFATPQVRVDWFRNDGLDGKVSRIELGRGPDSAGSLVFYEGNGGSQNKVCEVTASPATVKFKGHPQCDNDEARSVVLVNVRAGQSFSVHDDPNCGTGDDWTRVEAKQNIASYTMRSFEKSYEDENVRVAFTRKNGLDGKVSCLRVQ